MQIQVNGELRRAPEGLTLAALVDELGLAGTRYAVEVNEELVPRSEHETFTLSDGDRVEVVQAIGGG